jgi:peptide/nickel transport system substrate-binding protein
MSLIDAAASSRGVEVTMIESVHRWSQPRKARAGRRLRAVALALLVLTLLLAACGDADDAVDDVDGSAADDAGSEQPDSGGGAGDDVLTIRLVSDIQTLDPAFLTGTYEDAIMLSVAEGLLTWDPATGEVVNQLAASFESSDDGLEHTFTLKEGIQFHGGYGELTAEDVKYSYERIAGLTDPPLESTYAGDWAALEEVEVTGDHSGVIRLSEPYAPLITNTLAGSSGMVISKEAAEEFGEDFGTNPIGTGPFEFVEWEPGAHVRLARFDDYGGASYDFADETQWSEIVFRPIPDDGAADIALETGELDFGHISHGAVDRFDSDGDFAVTEMATFDYAWVGMNVEDDVLSDVEVRRAIRQAIDTDAIIEAAFDGRTTRANTLVSPEMPIGHWADAPAYDPDPEVARQILDDAGYGELDLRMSFQEEPGSQTAAEIVQANLAEIGINVEVDLQDSGRFREEVRDAEHQLIYISFSNNADPSWATVWFTCAQVGDWNYMTWCNDEFDELHEAALVEQDPEARHDMYVRMQEIMDEDAVANWVMYRTHYYTYPASVEPAFVPARYGKYVPWDFRSAN